MRVIKPGREQKGWAKEFACTGAGNGGGGCSAILLVEFSDLFITTSSHYDGSTDCYTTFKCACCGVMTDIKYDGPNPGGIPKGYDHPLFKKEGKIDDELCS